MLGAEILVGVEGVDRCDWLGEGDEMGTRAAK
jgi:hypothetical protein